MLIEEYWIKRLGELNLFDIFKRICKYTVKIDNDGLYECMPVNREELFSEIRKIRDQSDCILQTYIDQLIDFKLCCYTSNTIDQYFEKSNSENMDIKISNIDLLTNQDYFSYCSGIKLYKNIIDEEDKKKSISEIYDPMKAVFDDFDKEIDKIRLEFNNKIENVEKMTNDNIIKNIQVISIFAGIIALLFSNIMGIKEYASIGYVGIMLINSSLTIAIITMLLIVKLSIQKGKIDIRSIVLGAVLLILTFVPIGVNYFISK